MFRSGLAFGCSDCSLLHCFCCVCNLDCSFVFYNFQIGLKQGLEMLNIFKSYTAKTSLLDDFIFYEDREKSLKAKRSSKPATLKMETYDNNDITVSSVFPGLILGTTSTSFI